MSWLAQEKEEKKQNVIAKEAIALKIIVSVIALEKDVQPPVIAYNVKINSNQQLRIKRKDNLFKFQIGLNSKKRNRIFCSTEH